MSFDISPAEYEILKSHYPEVVLIDVREEEEYETHAIQGSILKPLKDLEVWSAQLDKSKHYVVHCRSGIRSLTAVQAMVSKGFNKVQNLTGGILAWERYKGEKS